MGNPSLYIACGGTGCKTIQSLAELISQDPELRYGFNNRIFFVLVDTEQKELERTSRRIRDLIPNCDQDHVITIRTSSNAMSLEQPVREAFSGKIPKGLERLKEHWWFNDRDGLPFVAPGVSPLDRGAGQCPPVSYFLAWRMLDDIERQIEKVFEEIIEDLSGDRAKGGEMPNPFDGLNYHIISGIAGGTGRGCWELLAFKIRQMCEKKFGAAPRPKAILFDASVTSGLNFNEATRIGTQVNSMTALSQLQCWERMVNKALRTEGLPKDFVYRLPSMRSPENEQADVLVVGDGVSPKPPVEQAYLIFKRAGSVAVLDKADDYYLMAGRALYAQLRFFEVGSQNINSTYFYQSLGAASFEVPVSEVSDYYQSGARVEFLRSLVTATPDTIDSCFNAFSEQFRFNAGFKSSNPRGLYPEGDEKKFTLWQKLVQQILTSRAGARDGLQANLEDRKSDLDALEEEIKSYITLSDQEAADAAAQVFSGLKPFTEAARPLLEKLYYRGADPGFAVKRSAENLKVFCERADRAVLDDKDGCLATMPKSLSGISIDKPLEVYQKTKGREFHLVGRRFDEGEITQILDAADKALVVDNYERLRRAFVEASKRYLADFKIISKNISTVRERIQGALEDEAQRMAAQLGVKDPAQCHARIFTDPESPADSDAMADSRRRFVQRRLKPARSEAQFRKDCDSSAVVKMRDGHRIDEICYGRVFGPDLERRKIEFSEDLKAEIATAISIAPDFIEKTFSLSSTIEGLREAWQGFLNKSAGDRDNYRKMVERFAEFYGFEPSRDVRNEVTMPGTAKMVQHMAASLAASTAAYWDLDQPNERKVHVFMPHFDGVDLKEAESGIEKAIERVLPKGATVDIYPSTKENATNPFVMVALHQDATGGTLDGVRSAQYWSEPGVIEQLRQAERPGSANSIFNPLPGMNGATYPDPIFVTNKAFSDNRWKPWVTESERKEANVAATRVLQALIYLFMEPAGRIGQTASDLQWRLPLAELKTTGTLRFTRSGLEWRDGRARTNTAVRCKIRENAEIGRVRAGIAGVRRWLASPEGRETLDSILQERDDFWRMIEEHAGLVRGTAGTRPFHVALCEHQEGVLTALRGKAETNNPEDEEAVWSELIDAVRNRDESLI
jgi:hypothetical protein